ncbi:MAG: aminoglycoside phosphotransferase family protein [Candidatus Devosia phytovorans]|uniref:Aminoglycoside phosphotransferase family protein n=1 Tax=Candidatus Devosia phytovorans TaxID=3121372 RepID=A0AAJ5VT57_9HYPH|nr:aminoglycoside phosphotransferase family protein [Devosia sp.]WEK03048.1 MAG: aminoglycoside phosphotransferase family protein [Devosia sp.]
MPQSQFDLDTLKAIIVARFPELAGSTFTLLSEGWDSVAVDVDDRLIFKFPRDPLAAEALRRESSILGVVGPAVAMRVTALELFEAPQLFSRHVKISGEHLLAAQYEQLGEAERQRMGEELGLFYARLHAIPPEAAAAAGALPVDAFLPADAIRSRIAPVLPSALKPWAEGVLDQWAALTPDPYGTTYGFFDGHGWNMAFDHGLGQLNGVYDFADSGIGPLHQDFLYSSMISPDLTERIISAYEAITGRQIDRARVDLLTAVHRLWELAEEAHLPEHVPALLASIEAWATR